MDIIQETHKTFHTLASMSQRHWVHFSFSPYQPDWVQTLYQKRKTKFNTFVRVSQLWWVLFRQGLSHLYKWNSLNSLNTLKCESKAVGSLALQSLSARVCPNLQGPPQSGSVQAPHVKCGAVWCSLVQGVQLIQLKLNPRRWKLKKPLLNLGWEGEINII